MLNFGSLSLQSIFSRDNDGLDIASRVFKIRFWFESNRTSLLTLHVWQCRLFVHKRKHNSFGFNFLMTSVPHEGEDYMWNIYSHYFADSVMGDLTPKTESSNFKPLTSWHKFVQCGIRSSYLSVYQCCAEHKLWITQKLKYGCLELISAS